MEEALITRLRGSVSIADLVGTRNSRPAVDLIERGETLPCATVQDVTTGRRYAHDGATGLGNVMMQIDCWAKSYGEAKLLARAIRDEMETAATVSGVKFDESFLVAERGMIPEDLGSGIKVFRQSLDFSVWFQPA